MNSADAGPSKIKMDYRPVHLKPLDSEMPYVEPKARVY